MPPVYRKTFARLLNAVKPVPLLRLDWWWKAEARKAAPWKLTENDDVTDHGLDSPKPFPTTEHPTWVRRINADYGGYVQLSP